MKLVDLVKQQRKLMRQDSDLYVAILRALPKGWRLTVLDEERISLWHKAWVTKSGEVRSAVFDETGKLIEHNLSSARARQAQTMYEHLFVLE